MIGSMVSKEADRNNKKELKVWVIVILISSFLFMITPFTFSGFIFPIFAWSCKKAFHAFIKTRGGERIYSFENYKNIYNLVDFMLLLISILSVATSVFLISIQMLS